MSHRKVTISAGLLFFVLGASLACVAGSGTAPSRSGEGAAQEISGGLWRVDHSFESIIRIKNDLAISPLLVTPVLFMADGTEYDLATVEIPQSGEDDVSINDALRSASPAVTPHISAFGTAAVRFSYAWKSAEATIENLDVLRSLVFNYPLDKSSSFISGDHSLQGLWWLRSKETGGFVALSNISAKDISCEYEVTGAAGNAFASRSMNLAAHATKVLNLRDLISTLPDHGDRVGGLTVRYTGVSGSLAVAGGLEDDSRGYSAVMPFVATDHSDGSKATDVTIASTGLMVGKPDPMEGFPEKLRFSIYVAIHNNSDDPLAIATAINYMLPSGPETVSLGEQVLNPHESRRLRIGEMLDETRLSSFSGMLNLTFSYTGLENDLTVATGSIDQSGTYVFAVLPHPLGSSAGRRANYWSVQDGFDTMIALWNPSAQSEDLLLTLHYADGSGSYKLPISLSANVSTMVGIADLVKMQRPGVDGNVIPPTVGHGSLEVTAANDPTKAINFAMSSSVFNARTGTCNPSCESCNGFTSAGISPGSIDLPTGNSQQINSSVTWYNGYTYSMTNSTSWTTTNSAIALFQSSPLGMAYANGPGSSPLDFSFTSQPNVGQVCNSACPQSTVSGPVGGLGYTAIQHNYPNKPTPTACWVSQFYDSVNHGKPHHAEDIDQDNGNGNHGGLPYGTPVYASEGGTVVQVISGNGPAPGGYPSCLSASSPANYIKIQGSDGYYTVYVHVTPTVSARQPVTAGQQIGITDNSGCQSTGHIHMARKDPNNNPVNFTVPCTNQVPTNNFWDGVADDNDPDSY